MGTHLPPPQKDAEPPNLRPCLLWPNDWMDKMALVMEVSLGSGHIVLDRDLAPPPKWEVLSPQFYAHVYCGQTAGWIKIYRLVRTEIGPSPGDIVLDGDPVRSLQKGHSPPPISVHSYWGQTAVCIMIPRGTGV